MCQVLCLYFTLPSCHPYAYEIETILITILAKRKLGVMKIFQ